MINSEDKFSNILVIGNGFDLNLQLKTSYSDFIASQDFNNLLTNQNSLAKSLSEKHNLQNWIDIENELKNYSKFPAAIGSFEEDYYALCQALINYLNAIDYSTIEVASRAYELVKSISKTDFLILDFNYTRTGQIILQKEGISKAEIEMRLLKMHGSLESGKNNIWCGG